MHAASPAWFGRVPASAQGVAPRAAQPLAHADPRFEFADEVSRALHGGRSAILPPASRQALMRAASRRGLRPFDATLIIAIVQDRARRGDAPARASREIVALLMPPARARRVLGPVIAAAMLGALGAALLILWVLSPA